MRSLLFNDASVQSQGHLDSANPNHTTFVACDGAFTAADGRVIAIPDNGDAQHRMAAIRDKAPLGLIMLTALSIARSVLPAAP